MNTFEIAMTSGNVPEKVEELVPFIFAGEAAVRWAKGTLRAIKSAEMANEEHEALLKEGQRIGEIVLDAYVRLGELLPSTDVTNRLKGGRYPPGEHRQVLPNGVHRNKAYIARTLKNHPEELAEIKKQARENNDIPTRTAVLNKVAHSEGKEFKKEERKKGKAEMGSETASYLIHLDQAFGLIEKCPDQITEKGWEAIRGSLLNIKSLIEEMLNATDKSQDSVQALPGA